MSSNISNRVGHGGGSEQSSPAAPPSPSTEPTAGPSRNGCIDFLDGQDFKSMFWAGYAWLERHREIVDALNVFPVPDGDTGTNMYLTMQAAWNEIDNASDSDIGRMAQLVAQGALMGARGNSGVILSQILRGLAHTFRNKATVTARDLVAGLQRGSDTAYKGVVKPVEGTILTVIREAAAAAQRAASVDQDLAFVFLRTVQAAGEAVERTPSLLPVLARAGVVDSGGKGLLYILEGMLRGLHGETMELSAEHNQTRPEETPLDPFNLPPIRYGFDVQFLIWGRDLNVQAIRRQIAEMGEYPLVEGTSTLVKVHVHVFDPTKPLSYALTQGFLTDVIVENMDAMAAAGNLPEDVTSLLRAAAAYMPHEPTELMGHVGVIAVAPGLGLRQVFESLGVGAVVSGGQTMNPSTQELLEAIDSLPTEDVIVLPNNSNIILAAQQAGQLSAKRVEVVPSRTVPQGISAFLAFNLQADFDENVGAMRRALATIDTGEVTVAVRDADIDGVDVKAGDVIGLLNDTLTTKGESPEEVVMMLLAQMDAHLAEIITVYYGDQVEPAQAEALGTEIQAAYPSQDVEIVDGSQPYYHYIISSE